MKAVVNSFLIAFSMYSRIPFPRGTVSWTEENRRYVMCFFPLVGAVIGALLFGWAKLSAAIAAGPVLRAAVGILLPLLVTGGIHLDGFLDVCDACSSWKTRQERLQILKDPHVGAFAVIGAAIYFVAALGLATEITACTLPVLCLAFPFSRTLSALSVLLFPSASPNGTAEALSGKCAKRTNGIVLCLYFAAIVLAMVLYSPGTTCAVLIAACLAMLVYLVMVRRVFGGTSGDLAGHFVCVCELLILAACAATELYLRMRA